MCLACGGRIGNITTAVGVLDPRPLKLWALMHDGCAKEFGRPSGCGDPSEELSSFPRFCARN
jgi:hypothetical protein